MRLLADENLAQVDTLFAEFGELRRMPGRQIDQRAVSDADVLLLRSTTRVDEALLADSPVRFVGTATIGTDHIDTDVLERLGIGFASAPG